MVNSECLDFLRKKEKKSRKKRKVNIIGSAKHGLKYFISFDSYISLYEKCCYCYSCFTGA